MSELLETKEGEDHETYNLGQQSGHAIILLGILILDSGRIRAYGRVPVRRPAKP